MNKILLILLCAVPFICSAVQVIDAGPSRGSGFWRGFSDGLNSNNGQAREEKERRERQEYNDRQEQLEIQRQMLREQQKANSYQHYGW